jgi:hypothetical protein
MIFRGSVEIDNLACIPKKLGEILRKSHLGKQMKRLLLLTGVLTCLLTVGCEEKDGKEERRALDDSAKPPVIESNRGRDRHTKPSVPKPDTVESLADELGEQLKEMDRVMKAVSDVSSAKVAADTVARISAAFVSISERLQKLEIPSDDLKRQIMVKMEAQQAEMAQSRGSQQEFINNLPHDARQIVEQTLESFQNTLNDLDPIMTAYFEEGE